MTGTPSIAVPRDASRTVQAAFTAVRARVAALEREIAADQASTVSRSDSAVGALAALASRVAALEAAVGIDPGTSQDANLFIQDSAPATDSLTYLWLQTNAVGDQAKFFVEDGS